MNELYDHDGDAITLTEDDKAHMREEMDGIEAELRTCNDHGTMRELGRRQRHLFDELAAGHRLPLHAQPGEPAQGLHEHG